MALRDLIRALVNETTLDRSELTTSLRKLLLSTPILPSRSLRESFYSRVVLRASSPRSSVVKRLKGTAPN